MAETWQTVSLFANTHHNNLYLIQFMEFDTKYHFIREETAIYQNSHTTSHSRETFTIWKCSEILQEVCLQRFWQDCILSFPDTVNPRVSPRGAYLKFRRNWGRSFEGALNWFISPYCPQWGIGACLGACLFFPNRGLTWSFFEHMRVNNNINCLSK